MPDFGGLDLVNMMK